MKSLVAGLVVAMALASTADAAGAADALIVLTTTGFLTGAADGCRVAADDSNALAGAMSIAISGGKYGDQAEALAEFNRARQRGTNDAIAGKVDCAKIASAIHGYLASLRGQ